MDVESRQGSKGDALAAAAAVSVDWRGRTCDPVKHGGMKAAVFVLGSFLLMHPLLVQRSIDRQAVLLFLIVWLVDEHARMHDACRRRVAMDGCDMMQGSRRLR